MILSAVKRFSKFVLNDEKAFALELQSLWKDKQEEKPKHKMCIRDRLVDEYWHDNWCDIVGIVDGSFLEDYDEFNIGAAFRNAAAVSTTYAPVSYTHLDVDKRQPQNSHRNLPTLQIC